MNFQERIYWLLCGKDYRKLYKLVHEGFAQYRSAEYRAARTSLLQALELRNSMVGTKLLNYVLMTLGGTWILTDEYEEAIAFFSEYIGRYPNDAMAYCERASAFWYLGKLERAVDDYNRSIELAPVETQALSSRAQVLAEMGRYSEALEEIDQALEALKREKSSDSTLAEWLQHSEAFLHRARGAALAGLGRIDTAMDEFRASIRLSPENAWAFYSRAEVYETKGDSRSALTDYQLALSKKAPPLNLIRRKRAEARVRELASTHPV